MSNHPVVGVTWYDALAFTRWLTELWQKQQPLPVGWAVKLSSEAEWEKAARGGVEILNTPLISPVLKAGKYGVTVELVQNTRAKRAYPWGKSADPNPANYSDKGIGATSVVGCFPIGASPYGCEEMSGNVWEWTCNLWGQVWNRPKFKYPYKPTDGRKNLDAAIEVLRVVRGGSYYDNHRHVRCAFRSRYLPDFRSNFIGFRVVVSPHL